LASSKSLVTANKAMLALHGPRLATMAETNSATIGWEAAVGGGIPCIKALREGLAANEVTYAAGIMNGAQQCQRLYVGPTTAWPLGRCLLLIAVVSCEGLASTPGTCNFILTTMKETGRAFDDVLAEAQEKGCAHLRTFTAGLL
jgi:homoserine dehydrogenase